MSPGRPAASPDDAVALLVQEARHRCQRGHDASAIYPDEGRSRGPPSAPSTGSTARTSVAGRNYSKKLVDRSYDKGYGSGNNAGYSAGSSAGYFQHGHSAGVDEGIEEGIDTAVR